MSHIQSKHALDEFLFNIQKKDLIKARLVLEHIHQIREKEQKRILFELSKNEPNFALPLLANLKRHSPVLFEKYPTLQEILVIKALDDPDLFLNLLQTANKEKIIYIQLTGETRFHKALKTLHQILQSAADNEIISEAIIALGAIADPASTELISNYLFCGEKKLVKASILALGQIATPEAENSLAKCMGRDRDTDMQILEVCASIQNNSSLNMINQALNSRFTEVRNFARQKLLEIGSKCIPLLLQNLLQANPELQIITLDILGEIGDESAVGPIRSLIHADPKDSNVRFAAYQSLGFLPMHKAAYTLASGLTDPAENVRMAAAKAINTHFNEILSAGIKNMLKNQDEEARKIVRTIMDSQANNIFLQLLSNDFFSASALAYLKRSASWKLREHYIQLLQNNGQQSLASSLIPETKIRSKQGERNVRNN